MLPDALSRRPPVKTDLTDDKNINEFIKQMLVIRHEVCLVGVTDSAEAGKRNGATSENVETPEGFLEQAPLGVNNLLDEGPGLVILNLDSQYLPEYLCVAEYLTSLRRSRNMPKEEFKELHKKAIKYLVQDRELFRRGNPLHIIKRVIDNPQKQRQILKYMHM